MKCIECDLTATARGRCQRHYDIFRRPHKTGQRAKPAPRHDLTGRVFKDAKVLSRAEQSKGGKARWNCACRCGASPILYETHLLRGMSGGCNHGVSHWPEYSSWTAMRERVLREEHEAFHRYGGRGIKICDRWADFLSFYEDMGPRPPGKSLDRFPNKDGDYEPGNCRWATPQEQQNNLSSNRFVNHEGESLTVAQLARKLGVNYETLYSRVRKAESNA